MKQLRWMLLPHFLFFCFVAPAQIVPVSNKSIALSSKTFFTTDEPISLTLLSDFKALRSQKKKGVFQDAVAIVNLSPTDSIVDAVKVAARGEFRRELCQMPSLSVDFKADHPSLLNGLKKLKLVCGCSSTPFNERLLLMEYLTYRIYNFITDKSFKARLVKLNYRDINDKIKAYTQYAFFIEDVDVLASRNGCKEYEGKPASSVMSDRDQTTILNLFQYMIGNTDWSVPNYHNIKLIQSKQDSLSAPYAVPYDFDFAGIINAPYAFPNSELFSIEKVTDRLYRGYPRTEQEIETALQLFRDARERINAMIMGFEPLKLSDRQSMVKYLDGFYTTINNKKAVKYEFVNGAKQ